MTTRTTDVIIVGGGIVGCLTAYLLARQGLRVTLLEKDATGSHASGFAFGEMGPLEGAGIPDPLLEFSLWCLERQRDLAGELGDASGVDYQLRFCESLKLAFDQAAVDAYAEGLSWQQQVSGFQVQWLDPAEVVKVEPMANPHCLGALYVQGVGSLEPYRYGLAAAQAGERFGVDIVLRRATGLISQGNRCLGVSFEGGQLEAGAVALTMGPWAGPASSWCGVTIPVSPLKGQILRLDHRGPPINTSMYWNGSYVVTKPDGLTWAGTTEELVGFDEEPTPEARDSIMSDLLRIAPAISDAQLVRQTACLRPFSSDGMPIVGKVPGWENLLIGTGAGRKGILWSTGMSYGLSDLVLGRSSQVPGLEHLDPGRFNED